ncbi:MAG: GDP-mannose 4,6-dehydratase [Anaerolineae bacterium]|nr:GDP-mannose 4,6-dehydratase [Anaerolineae bacterium]
MPFFAHPRPKIAKIVVTFSRSMHVLITGMNGFAGTALCELLTAETPWSLIGVSRSAPEGASHERVAWAKLDLGDAEGVTRLMQREKPDAIVHLAGQAHVPTSWADPWGTFEINVRSQLHLFQGVLAAKLSPRILVITSNEIYGAPRDAQELPFRETRLPCPNNPYAVSKVAADAMALQYYCSHKLDVLVARPFNHTGPKQNGRFVVPDFARQVAEIEAGKREPVMRVGNMSAQRDYTDVRDIARAYLALLRHGKSGETYNVCSGTPRSIQSILDHMLQLSSAQIRVETDPSKFRVVDTPISYGDNSKIRQATGWQPQIPFEQTIADILNEWRGEF